MDNFANYRDTLGKNRLGKQFLGNFTNGNIPCVTLHRYIYHASDYQINFTLGYDMNKSANFFNNYYFSDVNSDCCVLYTKKDKFGIG